MQGEALKDYRHDVLHDVDGVSDESIKERISKAYRDQYKEAYRNDDFVRMDEIEELLDSTGFSFNLSNWEKAVDNEEE